MQRAFDNGPGDPNLATILVGARGTGKTALLTLIANSAQERGWVSANTSALPGMLTDLAECAARSSAHLLSSPGKRVSGVEIAQMVGISWDNPQPFGENWRSRMTRLLDALEETDTGLLLTVDEDVSFLRRARRQTLGRISDAEISVTLERTVRQSGGKMAADAIDCATLAIGGFPYMMQLVGYWMWEAALSDAQAEVSISLKHAEKGVALAKKDLEESVLEVTWNEMSPVDRKFVAAMLAHEGDVALMDIATSMGVKSNYATKYKKRLLEKGVIGEYGRNMLRLEIPGSREYFSERLKS